MRRPYGDLLDACAREGCPVCRCVDAAGLQALAALLESPEPAMPWSLCNWHIWRVPGTTRGFAFAAGSLSRFVHRVDRLRDRTAAFSDGRSWLERLDAFLHPERRPVIADLFRRRRPCPPCVRAADEEEATLCTLLRVANEPVLSRAYEMSAGLCAPHLVMAIERATARSALDCLVDRTLAKWRKLAEQVDTSARGPSVNQLVGVLAGGQGLFGNDVHGWRYGIVPRARLRRSGPAAERSPACSPASS